MAEPRYKVISTDYGKNQITVEFSNLFVIDDEVRARFSNYPDKLADIERHCVLTKSITVPSGSDGLPDRAATIRILEQQLRGCIAKCEQRRNDLIAQLDRKINPMPPESDLLGLSGGLASAQLEDTPPEGFEDLVRENEPWSETSAKLLNELVGLRSRAVSGGVLEPLNEEEGAWMNRLERLFRPKSSPAFEQAG